MADIQMTIQVAQDRKIVAISIAAPGQLPQRMMLGLEELDRLIGQLGDARSQMVAGQPHPDFEGEGVSISTVGHTKWYIKAAPPAGALFAFYHPKFGPVGVTLPVEQIADIVGFLTNKFILQSMPSAEKN